MTPDLPPEETPEGVTVDEINTAFKVLESVREKHRQGDRNNLSEICNEAHYLIQEYRANSSFTRDWNLPDVGDIVQDTEHNPRFGDGRVRVTEVLGYKECQTHYVDVATGKRSVAYKNPTHPGEAPVVKGRYIEGSGKEYAFPCTRLEYL